MGSVVRGVRFRADELAVIEGVRGEVSFNAWVRRACLRQAELEGALAAEGGEAVPDPSEREFRPDFGARLKW